jgi:uncharacterized membrane protein
MTSKAKLLGHPIHPMLIVFPLGLLGTAVVFDLIYLATDRSLWTGMAYYLIGAGLITGLLAAVFGLVDWLAIPSGTRAKAVGAWHGIGNVIVMALFFASWIIRLPSPDAPETTAIVLSLTGLALSLVTAWLGGELVDRLGVGVDDGAHLNAPSSLSGAPASRPGPEPGRRVA